MITSVLIDITQFRASAVRKVQKITLNTAGYGIHLFNKYKSKYKSKCITIPNGGNKCIDNLKYLYYYLFNDKTGDHFIYNSD